MTIDHDSFYGKLRFQPLDKVVIVIVTGHSPAVSCHIVINLKMMVSLYSSPERKMVFGKLGLLGESGRA